jgi:hypothetical protein
MLDELPLKPAFKIPTCASDREQAEAANAGAMLPGNPTHGHRDDRIAGIGQERPQPATYSPICAPTGDN